jgi:hypothetical protein
MFSSGEVTPESKVNGGLTKNVYNCTCCCDFETVAIITPIPMPASALKDSPMRFSQARCSIWTHFDLLTKSGGNRF